MVTHDDLETHQALALLRRHVAGVLIVGLATAVQLTLWPYIPESPLLLFYPAVVAATVIGGFAAGLTATLLSGVSLMYFFLPPAGTFKVTNPNDCLDVAIFVAVSLTLAWFVDRSRAATRRAERALAEARRAIGMKDEVLAVVAHDLRSPLQTISLGASVACTAPPGPLRDNAERTRRAAERASRLVADLLDAAAIDAHTFHLIPARWSVRDIIDEIAASFELAAQSRAVRLHIGSVPDTPVVCDRDRVLQALSNVVGNAIKYTPSNGEVTVAVDVDPKSVRFVVRDTGEGMTKEETSHAFDRFWRGTKGVAGSGLGLFIARAVAEAHGGSVDIASEVGRGTTIGLTLPAETRHAT